MASALHIVLFIYFIYAQFIRCTDLNHVRNDVYRVSDVTGLGRRFDGIGGISGGGATSKLLVNYPQKLRDEILDFLFKPNFGASLHILKVEIGGDGQSTDGTEASHKHTKSDENFNRGYEWWLMKEAKKRNPLIRLYGLPWAFPGWLGKTPYENPEETAMYVTSWLMGAKSVHNLTIDYIGIWNERAYDIRYIKTLRSTLDSHDFHHVQIVAADVKWEIAGDILKDAELSAAVSMIGAHYPGTTSSPQAVATNKPLWASEDYSTYNDDVGAGCWARILNQNYVNGNMTSTISWNLVASYYPDLPFNRDGLMTANEPWSGHYSVNHPIWVTAHTSQFTAPGWQYLKHGQGAGHLKRGGSYVSLVNNRTGDLTIVIETMTWKNSICIRPYLPVYQVSTQDVTFSLSGSLKRVKQLYVWSTKLDQSGDVVFKKLRPLQVQSSQFSLSLGLNEIYTLTTLETGTKGGYSPSPPSKPFPLPYKDSFQDYLPSTEPYNFAQQMGAFEVVQNTSSRQKTLRQMAQQAPIHWCDADRHERTYSVIGDHSWTDVRVSVEVNLNVGGVSDVAAVGAFVGVRATTGGCHSATTHGMFLFVFPSNRSYVLSADLLQVLVIKRGIAKFNDDWNKIEISAHGNVVSGKLNDARLFSAPAPPGASKNGFVALGTFSYGLADFKNAVIDKSNVTGEIPHYGTMWDSTRRLRGKNVREIYRDGY